MKRKERSTADSRVPRHALKHMSNSAPQLTEETSTRRK